MKSKHRFSGQGKALLVAPIVMICIIVLFYQFDWLKKNYFNRVPARGVERLQCDHCRGTGMVRDLQAESGFSMCPVCQGVGYHAVRRIDDHEVLCPACSGMGRVQDLKTGEYRECARCGGRGLIRTDAAVTNRTR